MRRLLRLAAAPVAAAIVAFGAALPGGSQQGTAAAASSAGEHAASIPAAPTPRGKPAFDVTFAGKQLDRKIWDTCYPLMPSYHSGCKNWGNTAEAEWYLPSQVVVSGGELHLIARRERTAGTNEAGKRVIYDCRSGMVTSYPGFRFEYGFVQVVAEIPHAPGLWPALWLAATNGQYPPEMDIVESWGVNHRAGAFFHPVGGSHIRGVVPPKMTVGWKAYSFSWTKRRMVFYIGRKAILTVTSLIPQQKMYFLADLAEYLNPRPGYCHGEMLIKSVKIWKYRA